MTRRSKRLMLLAHCILNQNAVVQPLARTAGALAGIVQACLEAGVGLLQLPCPEFTARGPERAQADRRGYDTPEYRAHCRALLELIRTQVKAYQQAGYEIVGLIGMANSPSCGITMTYEDGPRPGRGVFMEELLAMLPELEGRTIEVPRRYGEDPAVTAAFDREVARFCRGEAQAGKPVLQQIGDKACDTTRPRGRAVEPGKADAPHR